MGNQNPVVEVDLTLQRRTALEGAARYAGLLLAPADGFGLQTGLSLALWAQKELFCCFSFFLILGHFWCLVVSSVTFSKNLSNFKKTPANKKKFKQIRRI